VNRVPDVIAEIRSEWTIAVDSDGASEASAGRLAMAQFVAALRGDLVSPIEFAEAVWWLARAVPEFEPTLKPFIGMASEWQDNVNHRPEYDEEIRGAAIALHLSH
jgi:hypothetical protein